MELLAMLMSFIITVSFIFIKVVIAIFFISVVSAITYIHMDKHYEPDASKRVERK